ncbi:hypothetical protein [Providencia alcalifaciens]|uniref:hypothetical protein n=1 Tax=Providencia alcalifaciens TaxID=126385 RepID=UPI0004539D8F|nr:hypothetical protein [Providencia alcalifaciens]ETT03817.1 hypothetical protein HMPREF1562_3665 [Providencia alcalifaciens F90-2004]EUC95122.1 hypothetical protein HMPREF1567_1522 [Providencia alcalifaciens PAL-2]MTB34586.1 hypothetical protein [Providencia alcalifaciens]MTC32629.1 hypothetical protein [Providencia alcalifaciens]MTC98316.1 hypothetical protein [Providencia alcalifaciens]
MLAKYILNTLEKPATCEVIFEQLEQDVQSEVMQVIRRWRFHDAVILQCTEEIELSIPNNDSQCPERWIIWQVIDSAGRSVFPQRKEFFSLCQQAFWLKMQMAKESVEIETN